MSSKAKPIPGQDTFFGRLYYQEADYNTLHTEAEAIQAENEQLREELREGIKRIDAYWQSELRDCRNERDAFETECKRMREVLEVVHERFGPYRNEFAFSKRNALDKVSAILFAQQSDPEREAFVQAAQQLIVEGVGFDLATTDTGTFKEIETRILYRGWMARAALAKAQGET